MSIVLGVLIMNLLMSYDGAPFFALVFCVVVYDILQEIKKAPVDNPNKT